MATTKPSKVPNRASHPSINPVSPQSVAQPIQSEQTANGKKKKKKKGKGRGTEAHANHSDDELPQLETVNSPQTILRRSGLSPELESVHLSTTASLSASAAAAARLNATAQAQAELFATATDLYRKMEADSMPDDDDHWASLPAHIKNFVKMTYSQSTNPNVNANERLKAQSMFAIAQQMIQSGAGRTSPKSGQPPGAFPFDPAIFSDPAFNLAMEQTIASTTSPLPPAPGQPPRGPLPPTNVVLLNEFGSGEDQHPVEEEYFSEDEVDENVDDAVFGGYNNAAYQRSQPDANKKKSKKKKKKGSATVIPPAPPTSAPTSNPTPVSQSHPAVRPSSAAPLTSSRAAGKQPMSYTNTAPPPAPPSSRARTTTTTSKTNSHYHHPSPASSQTSHSKATTQQQQNKLWSTNSTEERERIKEFWLGLGEEERRALVKVEKEAVLKKMKEQQKHSCSCAVCGRKRHAIEEELEVLYDAYYEELEQYANHQQQYASSGGRIPPPPGPGPFPGSVELDKNGAVVGAPHHLNHAKKAHLPSHGNQRKAPAVNGVRKKQESEFEDEEGEDEEYEEEEYEEEDEEDEEEEDEGEEEVEDEEAEDKRTARSKGTTAPPRGGRTAPAVNGTKPNGRDDFFNFGNNLTVTGPGNILTVADDLLKNDGQKFLEMMEQLAERRMQREEEAAVEVGMDSEDDEDDEDGDEDDEEEEEEEEEDDEDDEVLTEEQKMEEGKRMFSIFAARMFEQRVLQAYREKVAQERQLQLLRELEDEDKAAQEKEAKKQKENMKKKQKKMLQKQQKDEERKQREAEKAAEEAEQKRKQQALEEETRKKREEERARREALRKQQEEERMKKEEERRKRQAEERERQAELERKKKEREERAKAERREREERERKVREEKEAKLAAEKAAAAAKREQQEKEERERRLVKEAEEKERREREAKERERLRQLTNHKNRGPTSPNRSVPSSGPSRNTPASAPKKILQKPVVTPLAPASASSSSSQAPAPRPPQQRPAINTQTQLPLAPQPQHAGVPSTSHMQSPGPSTTPISMSSFQSQFPSPGGPVSAVAMSPRPGAPFANGPIVPPYMSYGPPGGPVAPGLPGPAIPPPRSYPVVPGGNFESFRPLAPPTPIAPPPKGHSNPPGSPIGTMFNATPGAGPSTGPIRRGSVAERPGGSFGAVQRPLAPIAPIARPIAAKEDERTANSPKLKSAGSTSGPNDIVLGSSALVADDDEPIVPVNRRAVAGNVGQVWGAPGTDARPNWPAGQGVPFGAPARGPNGLWRANHGSESWQAGFQPHTPFASTFPNHSPPPGGS